MIDIIIEKKALKATGSCRSTHIKNICQYRANHVIRNSAVYSLINYEINDVINDAMRQMVWDLSGAIWRQLE